MADLRECIRNARTNLSSSDAAYADKNEPDRIDYAISAIENLIEAVEAMANAFDKIREIDL
jgi:hypothetical protein